MSRNEARRKGWEKRENNGSGFNESAELSDDDTAEATMQELNRIREWAKEMREKVKGWSMSADLAGLEVVKGIYAEKGVKA